MSAVVDRVVLVVFDGLRPDMIAGRMPALAAFGAEAITFSRARSVFPSLTRVATTAIGSGHWPAYHGIVGNTFHAPDIVTGTALDTANFAHLDRARTRWGRVVAVPTLGEALAAAGLRMAVVHGGSAGSAFLINPEVSANGHWTFSIHGENATQTPDAVRRAVAAHGQPPAGDLPRHASTAYVGAVALDQALRDDGPEVVVVWLPEPDTSYHYREIGSADADAAQRSADAVFAKVLDRVRGSRRRTALFALSDHGQITITGQVDLQAAMRADGLPVATRPGPDDRLGLTLGAAGEVRALGADAGLIAAAADWLMERPEVGMVFARDAAAAMLPGTLPLSAVRLDHARAPDLLYVMRSSLEPDSRGIPGTGLMSGNGVPVGGGMHGGLNRHELATVLMLSLPGGMADHVDTRPCGLTDIAPTVLSLLGLPVSPCDGRALPWDSTTAPAPTMETLEASRHGFAQRLIRWCAEGRVWLDHGERCDRHSRVATDHDS